MFENKEAVKNVLAKAMKAVESSTKCRCRNKVTDGTREKFSTALYVVQEWDGRRRIDITLDLLFEPKKTYAELCIDLKEGDPCLVRDKDNEEWTIRLYAQTDCSQDCPYETKDDSINDGWKQCLPYKGFEKYHGTNSSPLT